MIPARSLRPATAVGRGFSLVELMVAMAIGLVLLAALVGLFVSTSSARRELDRAAELHESGRYALESLRTELSQAGFYGGVVSATGTADPANDLPCSTNLAVWGASLAFPAHGSNQNDTSGLLDCVSGLRKANTDAIFLQRASTCIAGTTGCAAPETGRPYLQVSLCGDEFSTTPFVLAAQPASGAASPFTLRRRDCLATATAPLRSYIRRIYYVSRNDELSYVDVLPAGVSAPVLISGGVENLQIEYAIDADRNGVPEAFSHAPTAAQWVDVIGARLWVLARSGSAGTQAQGSAFVMGDITVTPNDRIKRHVFSTYVVFTTPQGNREQ